MFDRLEPQSAEGVMAVMRACAADMRPEKLDLGIGIYRDDAGQTPVFAAVKQAEAHLLQTQATKSYMSVEGDRGFVRSAIDLVLGRDRGAAFQGMQTPGGTGAIRIAFELMVRTGAGNLWCGVPSWANHKQISEAVGLPFRAFAHGPAGAEGGVDMAPLREAARSMAAGDALLLHGCCHNPTGFDYSPAQWQEVADLILDKGLLPILDLSYHGLGNGLEADAAAVRALADQIPNLIIAYGCDKNFGVYRDRVGALFFRAATSAQTAVVLDHACAIARANWSFPPDHGAAVTGLILASDELRQLWQAELVGMADRLREVRTALANHGRIGTVDLGLYRHGLGLFGMLDLTVPQIHRLRTEHAIYIIDNGRVNFAGLSTAAAARFVAALADVQSAAEIGDGTAARQMEPHPV